MAKLIRKVDSTIVDASYRHYEKHISSGGVINSNGCRLKWYEIAREDKPVSRSVQKLARGFIDNQLASQGILNENELGFVLLHRCGESFYFLMICTWREANELWKTVYYFDTEKMQDFAVFVQNELHKATFCVWELEVVAHEAVAWREFLLSDRNLDDQIVYLNSIKKHGPKI